MIISGISLSLIPAMAQFNTVSSASDYYREESVQAATKDKETASDNTGSGKGVSENTGKSGARGDVQRQMVVERYLSVSYPLPRIKVTSPYGYRKDPFTGKRKFHGGIDLQARGDKVLAMMDEEIARARAGEDDGGNCRKGRAGQDFRQVCYAAARELHDQLLPPFKDSRSQGNSRPAA